MAHITSGVIKHQAGTSTKSKSFTITAHITRIILGLVFLVPGLNGFFHIMPMPSPTGTAAEFIYGLIKVSYFLPFMAAVQVICGVLLLSNSYIPFALMVLFPITLNIFFFHLVVAPANLGMAILIMAAQILLAVYYWPVDKSTLKNEDTWIN